MAEIKKCLPYVSRVVGRARYEDEESGTSFKVYFVDIRGREQRERYEWSHCGMSHDDFLEALRGIAPEGIGFVIAFPHITKVFQFGPSPETNLYTRAYDTQGLKERSLDYGMGTEVACAAEMLIAAEEFGFWLSAESVGDYLQRSTTAGDAEFRNHNKLWSHYQART